MGNTATSLTSATWKTDFSFRYLSAGEAFPRRNRQGGLRYTGVARLACYLNAVQKAGMANFLPKFGSVSNLLVK
jgi:hypothetical protein